MRSPQAQEQTGACWLVRQVSNKGMGGRYPCNCSPSPLYSAAPKQAGPEAFLHLPSGCLAERWSGKKGDIASLGGKKSKKKRGRAKGSTGGGSSKQRKELGGLEEDANPEEEEGVQKASPLPHSPPDEL